MKLVNIYVENNKEPVGQATIILNNISGITFFNTNNWIIFEDYFVYTLLNSQEIKVVFISKMEYYEDALRVKDFKK